LNTVLQLLTLKVRLYLLFSSFVALFFIETYCSSVCSFIDGLEKYELVLNLSAVLIFHLLTREILYRLFSKPWKKVSLVRQAYYLSILSWAIAGVAASLLHYFRYPYFPAGSHLKLLSSYWILGAGVLAQLEYVIFEYYYKAPFSATTTLQFKERLSRRILESLIIFTVAPTITMLLTVMRYNYEGILDRHVTSELLYIGLLSIAAAVSVAYFMGRMLRKDTEDIVVAIKAVERGEFQNTLKVERPDELGEISQGINTMSQGLLLREQIKEAFGRFVNPKVAESFIHQFVQEDAPMKMGGSKQHTVILMADLRNFTALTEAMEPDQLIQMLNAYFSVMVEAIQSESGMVDKFMGDAVMALFGFAECENPELSAVRCAQKMRLALHKLNETFQAQQLPQLDNGIGIESGEVIAGYLGSETRLEFTVIGSSVNIASRIEAQTKIVHEPILFSENVARKVEREIKIKRVDALQLKGIQEKVTLYTIV